MCSCLCIGEPACGLGRKVPFCCSLEQNRKPPVFEKNKITRKFGDLVSVCRVQILVLKCRQTRFDKDLERRALHRRKERGHASSSLLLAPLSNPTLCCLACVQGEVCRIWGGKGKRGSVEGRPVDSAGVGGESPTADFCNSPAAFLPKAMEAGAESLLSLFECIAQESHCPGSSQALKSGPGVSF